ncbi:MAG: trigger factor [Verrucomicrobia bacterium]|nr:trigger factor [Verrucomicrobiota bacterium]
MEQAATESQALQNDKVRFTIHYKPACVVEFDVEAFEPLIKAAHKKAAKAIAKEVVLPGFRKGKAPEELIIKNFSKEVDKEWQQEIANACFQECGKLAQVPVLHRDAKITYKMKSHSPSGALLILTFETEPKVPHVDPKQMQLKAIKRPEVNEDKINETIRQVQLFFANWHHVHDRPVQEGDFVLLDVDVIEETPSTPLFSNTRFEVTEKSMAQWMRELVMGKKAGDSMEGTSVPDQDASAEDKEGLTPKKVRVTIKAIDTATLPALDDDFVKKLGVSTVAEMKTNITDLLNKQADAHVLEAQRELASEFLLTQYPFDLPATLIEKETQFRFRQLLQDADFQKYWESLSAEERTKTIKTVYEQSEKAVRMFYLCRQIVADAKIRIDASDIPPPSSSSLEMLLNPQKMFHHQRNPEIEHAEAFSRLVLEKAEDFVIRNATPV